ncbi:unnamed protein product [Caenorhabditis angaria]|uniref:GOLD domain-containing protein n=1 Tax=Caenorhabditis angaria TaxID=860376 RepID=A0A9P1ILT2_9PELO|nr:unnamed protein product [Caenorhabditis angaria]
MKLVVLLLLALGFVHGGEFDFTVEVPAGKFECFFQSVDIAKHKTLEVDYQVIDGGDLNINFMLIHGANVLQQDQLKTDGSHRIDLTEGGDYQVCFDNSFSYQTRKVVFFEIFLFDANGNLDESDLSSLARQDAELSIRMNDLGVTIDEFHRRANGIKNNLNKVEYHQALLRAHEARDRAIMSANFDRVTFWSLLHTLVLLGVAAIQVFMIRQLFEENSKIGRVLRKGKFD